MAASQAATLVFNGEFNIYKPDQTYTIGATFVEPAFGKGVGDNIDATNPAGSVTYDDMSTPGIPQDSLPDFDMPGWNSLTGGNNDLANNGVGGSVGLNSFAGWGSPARLQTAAAVGTVSAGNIYEITTQADGGAGSPIEGELVLQLLAGTTVLTPIAPLPALTGGLGFQTLTQTFDLTTLPVGVNPGDDLTVIVGLADSNNTLGGNMVLDNVTFDVVPEPSSALLLSLGGLALMRRRRK